MDSTINLLPQKDKQLKRDGQRKQSAEMVEMTKPQDRVFQERVVRMEGLLSFFKNIFRRPPKLPQPKVKMITPPASPQPLPPAPKPPAPVTKLETMMDRMPGAPKPPAPSAAPPAGGFLTKLFNRAEKTAPPAPRRPTLIVPPPPHVPAASPPPVPVRRAPAWAPPLPVPTSSASLPSAPFPNVPPSSPAPLAQPPFPPPVPVRSRQEQPPARSTEAQPLLGASLNVNLVPEQYQPEASVRDRILAASFVGGALLIVAGVAIGLYFYQQRLQDKVAAVDSQTEQVNVEIANRERDDLNDALVLQQRTSDVKRVLDQHVYWDAFFQKLEGVTLPTVAYSNMSVDVAGSVTLVALAKTYNDVGAQLLTYQRATDFITDVKISGATKVSVAASSSQTGTPPGQQAPANQSLVSFSVSMRVNPTLFYRR